MKELIQKAWREHADDPEGVRNQLFKAIREIQTPEDLVDWSKIWTHLVGFELGAPADALAVLSGVLTDAVVPVQASTLCDAYLLSRLATDDGREGPNQEISKWSLRLLMSAQDDFRAWTIKAEALLAEHRVEAGDWTGLHGLALVAQAALTLPIGSVCERSVAICLNNGVSSAVEAEDLEPQYKALLVELAESSRVFWQRVGTPLNDARGAYLIQLAANAANEPARAMRAAAEAQKILATLEDVDIDLVFVRLALADSEKRLGHNTTTLAETDTVAAEWKDGLLDWYENTRRRAFGER